MTSLLYGAVGTFPVPADENIVRMTTAPVTPDAPPAMADSAPDPQEVETDPNPLLGMATRQVASRWHQPEKYTPGWLADADAPHDRLVNERIASSGTAAAREARGEFGHGTIAYAEGIESVGDLRDGGKMGNEYFKTHTRTPQQGAGNYMTVPPGNDQTTTSKVAATGKDAEKESVANAYRNMWAAFNDN